MAALSTSSGNILFGFRVIEQNLCMVTVNIYAADGSLAAESFKNRLELHRRPAIIGRAGGGGIRLS